MSKEPSSTRKILQRIKDEEIRFLDLKFVDLFGQLQHLTMPTEVVDEGTFQRGLNFDGSSVRGFQKISESDMILLPDPSSVFKDPFFDDAALSVFCDIIDPNGYQPYSRDPRGVARKAGKLIQSLGIADDAFFGPEIEFFIFDDVRFGQETQHGYYFLNSEAAFWSTGKEGDRPNLGHQTSQKHAYFAAPPLDQYNNLRSKISNVLKSTGIQTELHHHEVGAAGQCEIGFQFGPLLHQADAAIKYKYVVRNLGARYGKSVTFMPKPLLHENGSGMHVNMSLGRQGENLFFSSGGYGDLSELALNYIGGILAHAPALCAICSPTTNSYRRLVPGYEAPMNLLYSMRNRSACVRVPLSSGNPKTTRIEFRTPDSSGNPYLTFAAILMAGLDGIQKGIMPPEPVDQDIYALAESDGGQEIQRTPASLEEAIDAMEEDHEFLTEGGVFTQDLIETWIDLKRRDEIEFIRLRPHPGEFSLYYNV